jgi:hypothetical protein
MTINELIAKLQALAPDYGECRAVVRGYEGGVDDVETVRPVIIEIDANLPRSYYYYGNHEVRDEDDIRCDQEWDNDAPKFDDYAHAVFIKYGVL